MGYVYGTSACFGCERIFSYNPMRVPSIIDPKTGSREPICLDCVNFANPQRVANGLDPIVPAPDAYEPCDENELE
jgi:hypothetical protein